MGFTFIEAIPAKNAVLPDESLNVLGGVASTEKIPLPLKVSLFGRCDEDWKVISEKEVVLDQGEHRHLYYTITSEWFQADKWDGNTPEEMELIISNRTPADTDSGVLVFIKR